VCDFSSGKRLPFSRGRGGVVAGEFTAGGSGIECSTKKNKMGNGLTKEEQVYQAVQNGNHNAVKALRREGASLEVNHSSKTRESQCCQRLRNGWWFDALHSLVFTIFKHNTPPPTNPTPSKFHIGKNNRALCAKNAEYRIMKLNESMLVMWFFFVCSGLTRKAGHLLS
jgi:hypothetical protein